jgi:hypothetical protein
LNQVGNITHRKLLDLKAFLEGPFDQVSGEMSGALNPDYLPLDQPYDQPPWNYFGSENMSSIPSEDIVDWVLIAMYDTTDASMATNEALIGRQAGLIHKNGTITGTDGLSKLFFENELDHDLFIAVFHRNHLPVLSAEALTRDKGVYPYDFTYPESQLFGNNLGYSQLYLDVWGLASGDADSDGDVDESDKSAAWEPGSGYSGYLPTDLNLDGQTDNKDKDDHWRINTGKASQLPE